MKKVMYFVLTAGLVLAGCSNPASNPAKNPTLIPVVPTGDVYVLGRQASTGSYGWWKNGVFTALAADAQQVNSSVSTMEVAGTDVFVGGGAGGVGGAYPTVWKNTDPGTTLGSANRKGTVNALVASGGHRYAGGDAYEPSASGYYDMTWTDEVYSAASSFLKDSTGTAGALGLVTGIALQGSSVLVTGNVTSSGGSVRKAVLWTDNGTPVALSASTNASGLAVYVSGTDVYVAGNDNGAAQVWKNGTPLTFSQAPDSGLRAGRILAVAGTDLWVAGVSAGTAKAWKNGAQVDLGSAANNSGGQATCVAAKGTDVYIGGTTDGTTGGYWINGAFQALTDCNKVYDIAVR